MKLSFNTLGCPKWDLATICERGQAYGFDGVDFRGYLDTLDITLLPEFTTNLKTTRQRLDNAGLAVSGVSSSIKVCENDKLDAHLKEARRTLATAHRPGTLKGHSYTGGEAQA
ncbi:MAG: sugar phosphate isomerase/epimerase, partial [Chloroflexi bacterium]